MKTKKVSPRDVKKQNGRKTKQKPTAVKDDRLELLFTIVNRSKAEYYADLLEAFEVNMQLIALGNGTADASMLQLFGLNDSEKAVLIGVIRKNKIAEALSTLDQKFKTIKNGKGIAYTVPLSGVIGTLIFGFLSNNRKTIKETAEGKAKND